jgi:hypothetical protein
MLSQQKPRYRICSSTSPQCSTNLPKGFSRVLVNIRIPALELNLREGLDVIARPPIRMLVIERAFVSPLCQSSIQNSAPALEFLGLHN